jgi:hypothetical protein
MRALLLSVATALGAATAALYGCDRLENPQREYATVSEEVFRGGWVPKLLPPTATTIRVQHNLDTNEVWIRFKTGTPDFDPAKLGFRRIASESWPVEVRLPRYASWWFGSLHEFRSATVNLYSGTCGSEAQGAQVRSGHILLAAGEVYLWCGGAGAA